MQHFSSALEATVAITEAAAHLDTCWPAVRWHNFFLHGMTVDQLRLRGRWKSVSALERYVQEAAAFAVRTQLSRRQRDDLQAKLSLLWDVVVASLAELQSSLASSPPAAFSGQLHYHPVMTRLLRQQKLQQLQEVEHEDSDND